MAIWLVLFHTTGFQLLNEHGYDSNLLGEFLWAMHLGSMWTAESEEAYYLASFQCAHVTALVLVESNRKQVLLNAINCGLGGIRDKLL